MPARPMEVEVSEELGRLVEELVAFAQSNYIAGPDLLWNVSACIMANMHGEIRESLMTRIMIPLDGEG